MSNHIPTVKREQVKRREGGRCFRCAGTGAQWHHRRSRSVRDQHQHCSCNGVWLCPTCHKWAHDNPFEARGEGLIVSRHQSLPANVEAVAYYGGVTLLCDGTIAEPEREEGA